MVPCPAPTRWWRTQASGLFLRWQLWLGAYSVGFVFFPSWLCCPLRFQNSPQTRLWQGFLLYGNFSSSTTPFPGWVSVPNSFVSLFVFYIFILPPFKENGLPFWVPGVLHQCYRSCFVEVTQRSNDLLMNFWGRTWSPRPIPLSSWDRPLSPSSWTSSTLSHPPKLLQSLVWVPWVMQQNFHRLSILHMVAHMLPRFSLHLTLSFLSPDSCP